MSRCIISTKQEIIKIIAFPFSYHELIYAVLFRGDKEKYFVEVNIQFNTFEVPICRI